jgi:hypothetical protein
MNEREVKEKRMKESPLFAEEQAVTERERENEKENESS